MPEFSELKSGVENENRSRKKNWKFFIHLIMWLYPISLFWRFQIVENKKKATIECLKKRREAVEECTTNTGTKKGKTPRRNGDSRANKTPQLFTQQFLMNSVCVCVCIFLISFQLFTVHWKRNRNLLSGSVECYSNRWHDFTLFTHNNNGK